jgi:hypothetical protein
MFVSPPTDSQGALVLSMLVLAQSRLSQGPVYTDTVAEKVVADKWPLVGYSLLSQAVLLLAICPGTA